MHYAVGRSEKYFSSISISDTLFPLYFSILRQVCFLAFFDLRTPSFANFPDCVYIADLHGEVGQNILGGQKNILTCFFLSIFITGDHSGKI